MSEDLEFSAAESAHPLPAGYAARDCERLLPEQHFSKRTDFARDRARVVHSSALRRLSAKTQVISPTIGVDFVRNRLTHSLEVSQVGREFATRLGLDPNIVSMAALAHDLGHPPFGHNGERALNDWCSDIGGFEGNAQTLRLISRLEPKVIGDDGTSYGLNLTRASLDATCKYPWTLDDAVADGAEGRAKFGVYADDLPVFAWFREGAPDGKKCIEAQVMDLSDDIAYCVHDFEDAVATESIDPAILSSRVAHESLITAVWNWAGGSFTVDELSAAYERLASLPSWMISYDGSRRDQARLKNLTSKLIGRFAAAATGATLEHFATDSLVRYSADMVVPRGITAEIAVMKGVVAAYVMAHESRRSIYEDQRTLLRELAEALWNAGDSELELAFAADWRAASDDATRKRAVVDQVASFTDGTAMAWHRRLVR